MRSFLSHGGGLNSWALYLWLRDQGIEFEAVFADHGADYPHTYQYMQDRITEGHLVTLLKTDRKGLGLYDYYLAHHMIPLRVARACTRLYKLVPLAAYMETPCVVYLGIDYGERHRIDRIVAGQRPGEEKRFPLADEQIDRKGCTDIITAHGWPVPEKSGCYVCPFQRRDQWRNLRTRYPDLYCRAKRLEDNTNAWLANAGRKPVYLADRPLDQVCEADQLDLWGEREATPCLCTL